MVEVQSHELPLGTILDGHYQILRLLGRGGMGSVYLAEETRLRRRYALKVLHPAFAQDRSSVERFLREAQILAQLEHPNIVDIHGYGEDPSGAVFFTMEMLEGEDLDARIRARPERPYSLYDVCRWGAQVARAVIAVHDAGIIHRDLKCSNIFVARRRDGEEVIKLLDFGIARPEDNSDLTKTGTTLGTPSYMAPEQVRNLVLDRRADIYAFGIILYKTIAGKLPFVGDALQVAFQQCESDPEPPSSLAPHAGISPAMEKLVLKAMAKRPEDRYQSMREVEAALMAIAAAEAPGLVMATEARGIAIAPDLPGSSPSHPITAISNVSSPEVPPPPGADPSTTQNAASNGSTIATQGSPSRRPPRWLAMLSYGSTLGAVAMIVIVYVSSSSSPSAITAPSASAPSASGDLSLPKAPRVPPAPAIAPSIAAAATKGAERPAQGDGATTSPIGSTSAAEQNPGEPTTITPTVPPPQTEIRTQPPAPLDPLKGLKRKAKACRADHGALGGAAITITYSVGSDGAVMSAEAPVSDELGLCLARAVKSAKFKPVFAMGLEINL